MKYRLDGENPLAVISSAAVILDSLKSADSCVFRIEEIPGTSELGF